MAQQLFKARGGFNDGGRFIMSGAIAPGTAQTTVDAAIGSLYGDTATGEQYVKITAGAGTANWDKVTRAADIVNMVSGQSWREPVAVHDSTTTATAAAVTILNSNTVDTQTVVSGMRILYSAFTTAPNVYIVSGVAGNWTLTEDTNAATSGDTLRVLYGTDAGQVWMHNGTNWIWVDALTNTEEQFIRTYIGKSAPGAQTPTYSSNSVIANGDNLAVAMGKLDADSLVQSNRMVSIEGINTTQQTEIDAIETGSGLSATGTYVAPTGTTYLGASTSLLNASVLLDAQANTQATNLSNEITRATGAEGLLQTELDATQTGSGLNADGTYTAPTGTTYLGTSTSIANATVLLDAQVNTNAQSIATEITNRTSADTLIQTELDAVEGSVGLNVDGTYTAPTGTNYLGLTTSVMGAVIALDTQVGTNTTNIANLTTTVSGNQTNLQAEVDAIESGSGLNVNGTYTANAASNYITAATSLTNADVLLDAQVKLNADAIVTLNGSTTTSLNSLQVELDATQTGAGLNADGTYTAPTGTSYLGTSTSISNATVLLDSQVNTNATNLATEILNRTGADTTQQAEIDSIETGAGLNVDGTYTAPTGTTYLGTATTLSNADVLLDAQIAVNTTNLTTEISDRTIADTNLQTQIGNTATYTSTTVITQGDALSIAIGKLDAEVTNNITRASALNTTAAVVDSVLVDSFSAIKWIVYVQDTANAAQSRAVEILATHDGTAISDATLVDFNEFGELETGIELPMTVSVVLNGSTGAAQAMDLSISATSAVDIKVARMVV